MLRKKVAAEIKRFIKNIKLSSIIKYEWEHENNDGPRIDGIAITISYRNGNWQHFDSTDLDDTFGEISSKFKLLTEKSKIDALK